MRGPKRGPSISESSQSSQSLSPPAPSSATTGGSFSRERADEATRTGGDTIFRTGSDSSTRARRVTREGISRSDGCRLRSIARPAPATSPATSVPARTTSDRPPNGVACAGSAAAVCAHAPTLPASEARIRVAADRRGLRTCLTLPGVFILRSHFVRNGVSKDAPAVRRPTGTPFETALTRLLRVRARIFEPAVRNDMPASWPPQSLRFVSHLSIC